MRKHKWLAVILAMTMLLGMMPALAAAVEHENGPELPPNYAFIPNSGEASVSKVDLVNMEEVARYYTAPRLGQDGNTINPLAWRTSRIAMDADGNAWVLNVGSDALNLQGSVVRIQADTTGLTTHLYPDAVLDFGDDEAVQVFPVGNVQEMPRAIAIDGAGNIWVGFYGSGRLIKYTYVAGELNHDPVQDVWTNAGIGFYEMKYYAPDGPLFISSRQSTSTPARPGIMTGIYTFNGATFVRETTWNPYSILIAEDGTVYATAYSSALGIRNKDTAVWTSVTITGSSQNRGMAFDLSGNIWIASTVNTTEGLVVYQYTPGTGVVGPNYTLTSGGTTPVGVGRDAEGNMWAICRTDANLVHGWIEGFNPETLAQVGAVEVGYRPYAYGDFVVPAPPEYKLCGFKWEYEENNPGEGWEIQLYMKVDGEFPLTPLLITTTDPDGKYCFEGLLAGDYMIKEVLKDGWVQLAPSDPDVHLVTLPGGETICGEDCAPLYNFLNDRQRECFDETAWAAQKHPGDTRFVEQGNWGTYLTVALADLAAEAVLSFPLYAGQHYLAGALHVKLDDGNVLVKYTTEIPEDWDHCDNVYKDGEYCGEWTGIMEYHLHVVDAFEDFNPVRTTVGRARTPNNPIPGAFDYKWDYTEDVDVDDPIDETGWINVGTFDGDEDGNIFIAAHAVMQWCGYECPPPAPCSLEGDWLLTFTLSGGGDYPHDMDITIQDVGGNLTGDGGYPAGGPYTHTWTLAGTFDKPDIEFTITYHTGNPGYTATAVGTVAADCNSMSGTWVDSSTQTGTWTATRVAP